METAPKPTLTDPCMVHVTIRYSRRVHCFRGQHLWESAGFSVAGEENITGTRWLEKGDAASSS